MSPFNAFLFLQGIETVVLRMQKHSENATAVAAHLAKHPKVTKVIHPSQQKGEARRRADAYMKGGYGGLVGMELEGGMTAGQSFIDHLKLLYHVANIGDARSLAIHPGSTTHSQLNDRRTAGLGCDAGLRAALDRHRAHR